MSKELILLTAIAAITLTSKAQVKISIQVHQPIGSMAKLSRYEGKTQVEIDSCKPKPDGIYSFNIPEASPKGIYKVNIGKGSSLDFIVANDSLIWFETYSFAVEDSLKVKQSNDNEIFINFRRLRQNAEQRMWLIESLRKYYPEPSIFSQMLDNEHQRIAFDLYMQGNNLASNASSTLVSSAIRLELTPQVVAQGNACTRKKELSDAWWQGIDLTNPDIRFLPKITTRLWDYLENLLCEGSYTKEEQDSVLSEYIQKLFSLPMHADIKTFLLNSLCNGFAESDYYIVISTLKQLSENSICPVFNEPELKTKLILETELMPGKKAFNFTFKPVGQKKSFKLSNITSKYTLVVFWSVWCPHCTESIPQIYNTYKQYQGKGFDVVAICIDDEEIAFHDFIKQNKLDWKNIRIPYDSNSKVILRYNVDETPKMFLIDRNLNIVSRPSTPEHVKVFLEKNL
ncbi:MAG TPA: TlpA family protein disulfide reductase [Bacteroidales bacterium]|nr:TlpA family protein disulfide reductase [Bacteroidales bacterium]